MQSRKWILPFMTAVVPLLAQVTLSPRRISHDFDGKVPLLWAMEGHGILKSATFRVLDDSGRERLAPRALEVRALSPGLWQGWDLINPFDTLKALESGRYIAEWTLSWEREGRTRQERTETGLQISEKKDGWLQQAFLQSNPSLVDTTTPSNWPLGGTYPLTLKLLPSIRRVRYQLVSSQEELTLRSWQDLPVGPKNSRWNLPGDAKWPGGQAQLWILMEDITGRAWVDSKDVHLGAASVASKPSSGSKHKKSIGSVLPPSGASVLPPAAQPTAYTPTNIEWLRQLDEPAPIPWGQTNRIATVTVGYIDEERNEGRLWPTEVGRPMSLGITGANWLGKPLYSVSYLLAQRGDSFVDLRGIADQALLGVSGGALPIGAKELSVGKVPAPVVFSPGKLDDFLGKPLVAGYGWAAHTNGDAVTAETWTAGPNAPPVGISAIEQAAIFHAKRIADSAGQVGVDNPVLMTSATRPFALTLASQDPLGRTILTRPIGTTKDEVVSVLSSQDIHVISTFNDGAFPPWIQVGPQVVLAPLGNSSSPSPQIALNPARAVKYTLKGLGKFQNQGDIGNTSTEGDRDFTEDLTAGSISINVGRIMPAASGTAGTTGSVQFTSFGAPYSAKWEIQGGSSHQSPPATAPFTLPTVTEPSQVSLRITNALASLPVDSQVSETQRLFIDNVAVNINGAAIGLKVDASVLAASVVPGYSRTQYGIVDIPGQGACTVTMVTDPDGSAVAEVKDPEGRTVYKVVNPVENYTNLFLDYLGNSFKPSAAKTRGLDPIMAAGDNQKNLLTQYVFDGEGHLRLVIPPMGVGTALWGKTAAEVQPGLAWDGNSMPTSPLPYATYNAYDQSGHLLATYNPDEGLTRFKVDQKGRVHFSQTASQRTRTTGATWTRTLYDQIFRVRAVGEVVDSTATAMVTEAPWVVMDGNQTDFNAAPCSLINAVSVNLYDSYSDLPFLVDPTTGLAVLDAQGKRTPALGLTPEVGKALPGPELWFAFPDGHLTRTEDATTKERYFYDQDGRIVIRWVSIKDGGSVWREFAIGIFYDFAGRVKRLVYPAGPAGDPLQVVYTYDDLGRLFAVGTPDDLSYFARYAYQPTGEVKAIVYGPGEGFAAKRMLQDPQGWLRTLTVQGR